MPKVSQEYDWHVYPVGTRAFAVNGGHWERVPRGWKWCTGATFPTPGGDASGILEIPEYPRLLMRGFDTPERFWDYVVVFDVMMEYGYLGRGYVLSNKNEDRESWKHLIEK